MWLMKTRPDMLFTVNFLSRYLRTATKAHLKLALDRPLRYLKGTMSHGIVFQPGDDEADWKLRGSGDSELAGDLRSSRTTTGYTTMIGKYGQLGSRCTLERKMCSSTGQGETYATMSLVKEIEWQRLLLSELDEKQDVATLIDSDNAGVISQSTKQVNHTTAKHYRISQAYIRDRNNTAIVKVQKVATAENESDLFTKALTVKPFRTHSQKIMGPQQPGQA